MSNILCRDTSIGVERLLKRVDDHHPVYKFFNLFDPPRSMGPELGAYVIHDGYIPFFSSLGQVEIKTHVINQD